MPRFQSELKLSYWAARELVKQVSIDATFTEHMKNIEDQPFAQIFIQESSQILFMFRLANVTSMAASPKEKARRRTRRKRNTRRRYPKLQWQMKKRLQSQCHNQHRSIFNCHWKICLSLIHLFTIIQLWRFKCGTRQEKRDCWANRREDWLHV